ncbi:NAD(P)H-quinone oxidoreductase [Subsaximicrobium wynnwilliamsii]|uniref:NAD(P)H-quinone oxidoreductase n=1 Tax=Subsaximicrobium wynnwilliamsii TaxID=291179 RepID=A0A5C6ZBX9_9FLAO|nr:NAD(P)H-quinone oxidoreductase [Subsaximicrobium wynnwilliamsii]TXD81415.1 NAD(P)H-quinone oxidoreductase [Subsaximicrobium wynnwilliamsii]TXD87131.1 NAD(P)H-quinone oxidoreductase [Subsaximicrobium wynnwilliamsii]TXE00685.1 NAD(P)H-quinone oxidoreductase [Subsaximicrobium wynnwilliamsii]
MKAIQFKAAGGPEVIELVEREKPKAKDHDVLIKIKAAGVNRPDVMQREGKYNPPEGVTDIPGLEVAGEIETIGENVKNFKVGDKVCAILSGGGYAEFVSVHEAQVAVLPKGLSFAEGAGLMETFLTVWSHLFKFAKFEAGKSILIHGGASGIGTTATMLCKAVGATKIFTTVSSAADQKASEALGADVAINYKTHDFVAEVKKHSNDQGVDFILDIIGGSYVQRNYAAAAKLGTILQVGIMKGKVEELNLFPMLSKRLTHLGITLRSQSLEEKSALVKELQTQVWPLIESGKLKPQLDKSFKLSETQQAHEYLDEGEHFGKIVLLND